MTKENVHFYEGNKPSVLGISAEIGDEETKKLKLVHTKSVPEGLKPDQALILFKKEALENNFDPKYFIALGNIALESKDQNTAMEVCKTAFENDRIQDGLSYEFGKSFGMLEKALPLLASDQLVPTVLHVTHLSFARHQPRALAGVLLDTIEKYPNDRVELLKEMFVLHRFNSTEKPVGEMLYNLRNSGTREEQLSMRQDMAKAFTDLKKRPGYGNDDILQKQKDLTKYKVGTLYDPTKSILKPNSGR